MPDVIQPAASGRAKCRGCGRPIATGQLRFGEAAPNPYAEGETWGWFHLPCAACMRPEKLLPVLQAGVVEVVPERDWLTLTAQVGTEHRRLPRLTRAERASSGRARCRSCREEIQKGDWRFSLTLFEEGRPSPIGTIHVTCAENYFGTAELRERIGRLNPDLTDAEQAEISVLLGQQRPAAAESPDEDEPEGDAAAAPGLAKTTAPAGEIEESRVGSKKR